MHRWTPVARSRASEPNESELKATTVLALPLVEASAKIRTGPPIDDEEDHALSVWAGVLPLHLATGEPVDDELLRDGITVPQYVRDYRRARGNQG